MLPMIRAGFRPLLLGALTLVAVACSPSEEGETRNWDRNVLSIQEFSGRFPAFRGALNERLAEAQGVWDKAKALSDKEQRAQQMRAANEKLTLLLTPFQEVDRKLRELDMLKVDPALGHVPGHALMPAMQQTDYQLQQVRAMLAGSPVGNAGEAMGILRDALTMLNAAMVPLQGLKQQAAQNQAQQQQQHAGQPGTGGQPGLNGQPAQLGGRGALGQPLGSTAPGGNVGMPGQPGMPPSGMPPTDRMPAPVGAPGAPPPY